MSFRMVLHKWWTCHHGRSNKERSYNRKISACKKLTCCHAKMDIKVKLVTKMTKFCDVYLRHDPPLCAVITADLNHNHSLLQILLGQYTFKSLIFICVYFLQALINIMVNRLLNLIQIGNLRNLGVIHQRRPSKNWLFDTSPCPIYAFGRHPPPPFNQFIPKEHLWDDGYIACRNQRALMRRWLHRV